MKKIFELKFQDNNASPVEIYEKNLHELEKLCKEANKDGYQVVLYSPEKYETPQNVYQLSAIIAEDMVKKYNDENMVVRTIEECKQLA